MTVSDGAAIGVPQIETPCINICRLDPDSGLCTGCLRSRDEIKAWRGMSVGERRRVMATLAARGTAATPPQ